MKKNHQVYKNKINLNAVFGNMYRKRHVLIVLRDVDGNYLLGAKPDYYPPDIYRLVGGGIDDGEDATLAAIRELKEELQIDVTANGLKLLAEITTEGEFEGKMYSNTTYLYSLDTGKLAGFVPSDDIAYLKTLTLGEMEDLIQRYQNFTTDDWYEAPDGYRHCWSDYGEMYSFIHQLAIDLTK